MLDGEPSRRLLDSDQIRQTGDECRLIRRDRKCTVLRQLAWREVRLKRKKQDTSRVDCLCSKGA